jgi:hypothetical protein
MQIFKRCKMNWKFNCFKYIRVRYLNKYYIKQLRIFIFIRWTGYFDFNSGCNVLIPNLPYFGLVNRKLGSKGANRNEDPAVGWAFAQVNFIPSVTDCVKLKIYIYIYSEDYSLLEQNNRIRHTSKVIYDRNRTEGNVRRNIGMVIFTQLLRSV